MKIQIIIKDDNDNLIVKGLGKTFESAEEELGKLERFIEKKEEDKVRAEELQVEELEEEIQSPKDLPDFYSKEYPLGGSTIEPYDIWREQEEVDRLERKKVDN